MSEGTEVSLGGAGGGDAGDTEAAVTEGVTGEGSSSSGRKNVLRKLLRIPYHRLKAGFSVC